MRRLAREARGGRRGAASAPLRKPSDGRPGDLLIGVSTSGNAKNVAAAVIAARAAGVATLGLSGRDGGELARLCDECLVMPEHETYRIQEYHIAVYHLLCAAVESELFEH